MKIITQETLLHVPDDVLLEHPDALAAFREALAAVINPLIIEPRESPPTVSYFNHVNTQQGLTTALNTDGFCVFSGKAVTTLTENGQNVVFTFRDNGAQIFLGRTEVSYSSLSQPNQDVVGVTQDHKITRKINSDAGIINGTTIVRQFSGEGMPPLASTQDINPKDIPHVPGKTFSTNSHFDECLSAVPENLGTSLYSLAVNMSSKHYKVNEALHQHRTPRLIRTQKGEIEYGVMIIRNTEGNFHYTLLQEGDCAIFKEGVWHAFAPLVLSKHLQQPGEDDLTYKDRKRHSYFSVTSGHVEERVRGMEEDTIYHDIEHSLVTAVRFEDLSRADKLLHGKESIKVINGELIKGVAVVDIQDALNAIEETSATSLDMRIMLEVALQKMHSETPSAEEFSPLPRKNPHVYTKNHRGYSDGVSSMETPISRVNSVTTNEAPMKDAHIRKLGDGLKW